MLIFDLFSNALGMTNADGTRRTDEELCEEDPPFNFHSDLREEIISNLEPTTKPSYDFLWGKKVQA